jgi:hypothetical protein
VTRGADRRSQSKVFLTLFSKRMEHKLAQAFSALFTPILMNVSGENPFQLLAFQTTFFETRHSPSVPAADSRWAGLRPETGA